MMLRKVFTIRISGRRYWRRSTVRSCCSDFSNGNVRTAFFPILFPCRIVQQYRSQQLLKPGLFQCFFSRVSLSTASLTFFTKKMLNTFEDYVFNARLNTSITTVKHIHLNQIHTSSQANGKLEASGSSRSCHFVQENYNSQETSEEIHDYEVKCYN